MVAVEEKFVGYLSAWAKRQIPSLYIRVGPSVCFVLLAAIAVSTPVLFTPILGWLFVEFLWLLLFRLHLVKQLTEFRPEDSGHRLQPHEVENGVDNITFLIRRDPSLFWSRATGVPCPKGTVCEATMRAFVRSLFFMHEDCAHYAECPEQVRIFEAALERIRDASGGFAASAQPSNTPPANLLRSWIDNAHLASLVRHTPLAMVLCTMAVRVATFATVRFAGFERAHVDAASGVECWLWRPIAGATADVERSMREQQQKSGGANSRPLVLLPGAGFGVTSFIPLALLFQRKMVGRTLLLYRMPWVEVCHPWSTIPQWSAVVSGMLSGMQAVGLGGGDVDVISHSYGTAVANRLLRELCKTPAGSQTTHPRIHHLSLLDPIVLGGATTGLASFIINAVQPDMSFAFCGNRAGVGHREVLDYDPVALAGQCRGGITVYMSADDVLVDVGLGKHIVSKIQKAGTAPEEGGAAQDASGKTVDVHFHVDQTADSFHGRWLVEMWCLGLLWRSPCATQCMELLYSKHELSAQQKQVDTEPKLAA